MVLIQLLLPTTSSSGDGSMNALAETRRELVERFKGVTAYVRSPAKGLWTAPDGHTEADDVVMVEVVTDTFDPAWWRTYSATLAHRFAQDTIHVRALPSRCPTRGRDEQTTCELSRAHRRASDSNWRRSCAQEGFDLLIAADRPDIETAADRCRECGAAVQVVQTDLATTAGVDQLWAAAAGRPVDALLANAGHGLGHAFLDQDFDDARHVIDTNITGTIYLVQLAGRTMRSRGKGRILLTGSIAGFMPGTYTAVYNGTKAFIDSFSFALRAELKDTGVTVTCLMPGATETDFFERADMLDTKVGQDPKDDPADVARRGLRRHDAGRRRRRQWLEEQTANGDGQRDALGRPCGTAPQDGRARFCQQGEGLTRPR
jgi:short-subunit dehydrogenase